MHDTQSSIEILIFYCDLDDGHSNPLVHYISTIPPNHLPNLKLPDLTGPL